MIIRNIKEFIDLIYKKKVLLEIMPLISESFNIFLEIPLKENLGMMKTLMLL